MAIRRREYLLTTNRFREPTVIDDKDAVGMLLLRLMVMDPGTDPLHPDMGVGIRRFRYGMENLPDIRAKVLDQINTYLPYFQDSEITFRYGPNHTLIIQIIVDDVVYEYDTSDDPTLVGLGDIAKN